MTALTPISTFFERLGFDRPKFLQGLQVSAAAFMALVLAWSLGLEHPQWAAITVFVTLQPTRGQIVEKGWWRLLGTILGSAYGAGVVWLFGGDLGLELTAITLWAALTVFLGSLQRSYRSYGTVLAGYSAIIVIVLNPFLPEMSQMVAFDRILTVGIGILSAVLWAYLARLQSAKIEVQLKARRLAADMLAGAGLALLEAKDNRDMAAFARLASAAGALQDELSTLTANGKYARSREVEHLLQALLNLLFAAYASPAQPQLSQDLRDLGARLHGQKDFKGMAGGLRRMVVHCQTQALEEALAMLTVALGNLGGQGSPLRLHKGERRLYSLDWKGACEGAIRITLVLGGLSLAWWLTKDPIFQYPLVSAAICMALATTGVTPVRKMVDVVKGQILAALIAVGVEMVLWSSLPSPRAQLLALILPALAFAFIRAHRRMSLSAPDYAITCFLLLSPSYDIYAETIFPPYKAAMAAFGGILGYLAFTLIFPTDARARRKGLWVMIKRDLQEIALMRRVSIDHESWRLSFCGRFLKIAHWAALEGGRFEKPAVTMQKGFVTLQLAELVFALKELEGRAELPDSARRALLAGLERISSTSRETDKLVRALRLLAGRFAQAQMQREGALVEAVLEEVTRLRHLRRYERV